MRMTTTGIQVIIVSGPMVLSVLSSFVKVVVRTAQVFLECMMIFTNLLIIVLNLFFSCIVFNQCTVLL